jgi:dTMP kinase
MADRQQHVSQVIRPALARGAVVLSDRYCDATLAYQAYGQGVDLQTIRELNVLATGGILPDLTLLLDLDPAIGMARIRGRRLDAFEKMDLTFHRRVRDGYLEIAGTEKSRIVVLDADQPPDALQASIARIVEEFVDRRSEPHGR